MNAEKPLGPLVLKLGGEVVAGPHLGAIAADIAELSRSGIPVVVVHGGGPQASDLQKRLGQTPRIVAGRRITDDDALEVMKMAVAGKVNVDLCSAIVAAGGKPVGLHGSSSRVVDAKRRPPRIIPAAGPDPIDFGNVGDVVGVNGELVALLINAGYVPVVACLGADAEGRVYNINADTVANRLAVTLDARALMLVTDVPGVLRNIDDSGSRIPRLTEADAQAAVDSGVITKGMIPKVEESFAAIREGVRAVHIVGKIARGDLAREARDPGSVGTVLVR